MEGNLRKMNGSLDEQGLVHYQLPWKDVLADIQPLSMNDLIGHSLLIEHKGEIHSILSGEKLKKTFGEGLSYKEFMESPQASPSIIRPELSRIHEGIALRDYDWELKHHMQPHTVYISLTNAYKVGVTRDTNIPYRWIDQGAIKAIRLAAVPYRQLAGLIEVALKDHISDKTHWQKMLKGVIDNPVGITEMRDRMSDLVPPEFKEYLVKDEKVTEITYPLQEVPSKISSLKLDRDPRIRRKLVGIKGQYLIFEDGSVFNVRSHAGYRVSIEVVDGYKPPAQSQLFN